MMVFLKKNHTFSFNTRCHVGVMSRACGMLVCCREFVKKIIKKIKKTNHMEKNYCNPQCFQGKNYKAKFLNNLILKK
jgi:hypothetical protein